MPYGYIYLIANLVNGKVYVGQTACTVEKRWTEHLRDAQRKTTPLYTAMRKYGTERFTVSPVAEANSQSELDLLETQFVVLYKSSQRGIGYNVRAGGEGGGKLSEATKEKLRVLNTGKPAHNKGKPMPSHQKMAMIERWKAGFHPSLGRVLSDDAKTRIAAANREHGLGRKATPEIKARMSEAQRKRWAAIPAEERERRVTAFRNKPRPLHVIEALKRANNTPEKIERRKLVIALRDSGLKWKEVAAQLSVTPATVIEMYQRHRGTS